MTLFLQPGLRTPHRHFTRCADFSQQGGSPHSITPQASRQFVIDHLERIDFRCVEKFALARLLTTCGLRMTGTRDSDILS